MTATAFRPSAMPGVFFCCRSAIHLFEDRERLIAAVDHPARGWRLCAQSRSSSNLRTKLGPAFDSSRMQTAAARTLAMQLSAG